MEQQKVAEDLKIIHCFPNKCLTSEKFVFSPMSQSFIDPHRYIYIYLHGRDVTFFYFPVQNGNGFSSTCKLQMGPLVAFFYTRRESMY